MCAQKRRTIKQRATSPRGMNTVLTRHAATLLGKRRGGTCNAHVIDTDQDRRSSTIVHNSDLCKKLIDKMRKRDLSSKNLSSENILNHDSIKGTYELLRKSCDQQTIACEKLLNILHNKLHTKSRKKISLDIDNHFVLLSTIESLLNAILDHIYKPNSI